MTKTTQGREKKRSPSESKFIQLHPNEPEHDSMAQVSLLAGSVQCTHRMTAAAAGPVFGMVALPELSLVKGGPFYQHFTFSTGS